MIKNLLLIKFFIVTSILAFGQGGTTIYGTVTDKESGERLPFAGIQISGSLLGGICDDKGEFEFYVPEDFVKNPILIFLYRTQKSRNID